MMKSYVRELCRTFEHNPVPGAQRTIEYHSPRETWQFRWDQCAAHLKSKGYLLRTGSKSTLRTAWKSQASIVNRTMLTHAKCDTCSLMASKHASLIGKTDPKSTDIRTELKKAKIAHQNFCAAERDVLDDAGHRAIMHRSEQWTFIADGATQRNFQLPKHNGRTPKSLHQKDLFCSKLYGVFGFG